MSFLCSNCQKKKPLNAFSGSQRKKSKKIRRCKRCIRQNQQQNQDPISLKFKQVCRIIRSNPKFEDIGLLKRLHAHCVGKSVFSEIYLAMVYKGPGANQVFFEHAFEHYEDTMIVGNRVIIACNDRWKQMMIFQDLFDCTYDLIYMPLTRLLQPILHYPNGTISKHGVQFKANGKSVSNSAVSFLFQNAGKNISFHLTGNEDGAALGLDANEHKRFRKMNATIKKSANRQMKSSKKIENIEDEYSMDYEANTHDLYGLQNNLKQTKIHLTRSKNELQSKQKKMSVFNNEKIKAKWNDIQQKLMSNGSDIFDQNGLERMVNILNKMPGLSVSLDKKRGHGSHILMKVNDKTITISLKTRNGHIMNNLNRILMDQAEKLRDVHLKNKFVKLQIAENKESEIEKELGQKEDCLEQLVFAYNAQIAKYSKLVESAKCTFQECLNEMNHLIEGNVAATYKDIVKSKDRVQKMWNAELSPYNLIMVMKITEPSFEYLVMQHRVRITEWIDENMEKYGNIAAYGSESLFLRFVHFCMSSVVNWWIVVLRWLNIPISVYNLNVLMSNSRRAVSSYFSTIPLSKMEIDIFLVIDNFMNVKKYEYEKNPFDFVHKERKELMLDVETCGSEEEFIRFSNECFHFAVQLIPKYIMSSSIDTFNRKMKIYMTTERMKHIWCTMEEEMFDRISCLSRCL